MMTKAIIALDHHSSVQWDNIYISDWLPYASWYLSTTTYYSAPSSLGAGNPYRDVYHLPKLYQAHDVKAGRLTTWLYNQIAGAGDPRIYIGVTGVGSTGLSFPIPGYHGTWEKWRYTWWQCCSITQDYCTIVKREHWNGVSWDIITLTEHPPMTGFSNRCGIGVTHQSLGYIRFWDDTIIELLE